MAPRWAVERLCALNAPERGLLKLLSHSSVVRTAFRDASISSESASRRLVVGFVGVAGAIVE